MTGFVHWVLSRGPRPCWAAAEVGCSSCGTRTHWGLWGSWRVMRAPSTASLPTAATCSPPPSESHPNQTHTVYVPLCYDSWSFLYSKFVHWLRSYAAQICPGRLIHRSTSDTHQHQLRLISLSLPYTLFIVPCYFIMEDSAQIYRFFFFLCSLLKASNQSLQLGWCVPKLQCKAATESI